MNKCEFIVPCPRTKVKRLFAFLYFVQNPGVFTLYFVQNVILMVQ